VEWVAYPEQGDAGFHFEKVGRRQHLDIASVNTAAFLRLAAGRILEARLSAGGVAPVPLLLRRTSEYLSGRDAGPQTLAQSLALAQEEIAPISDVRGSAEYKRRLLKRLLVAHFLRLLPQALSSEAAVVLLAGGAA
jgi:xanthine dehydrogenase small subunit